DVERPTDRIREGGRQGAEGDVTRTRHQVDLLRSAQLAHRLVEHHQRQHIPFVERGIARKRNPWPIGRTGNLHPRRNAGDLTLRRDVQRWIDRVATPELDRTAPLDLETTALKLVEPSHDL